MYSTCPSCGYCPTCGRGHQTYPIYPRYDWTPTWVSSGTPIETTSNTYVAKLHEYLNPTDKKEPK